jgi:hypothetical protein
MPESLVIGHPCELRHCLRPDCGESFNIVAVYEGLASAVGWRQLTRVVNGYLCPAHTAPCVTGGHLPRWLDQDAPQGMTGIGCACGWQWQPVQPATAGDHGDQWVAHLMTIDEGNDHA